MPDNDGKPFTYTFTKSTFNVQRNLARDIKLCIGHDTRPRGRPPRAALNHGDWLRGTFVLPAEIAAEVKVGRPSAWGSQSCLPATPSLRELSLVPKAHVDGAQVTHRYELKPKPVTPRPSTAQSDSTGDPAERPSPRITPRDEDEEFRRRLEFYGDTVPFELVLENMKHELQALKGRRW